MSSQTPAAVAGAPGDPSTAADAGAAAAESVAQAQQPPSTQPHQHAVAPSASSQPRLTPLGSRQTSQSPNTQGSATPAAGASSTAAAAAAAAAANGSAFRPLNVRDALSYLDRVKQQFASEYEVYDQFLTIMKQFKTQTIDTPGVIDRVSTLFRGHPALIQGFNTFLPPGYRIECSISSASEAGASNTITVTTPMGVTTRTQDVGGSEAREFTKTQGRTGGSSSKSSSKGGLSPNNASLSAQPSAETAKSSAQPPLTAPIPRPAAAPAPAPSRIISPPQPIPPFNPNKAASSSAPSSNASQWQPYGMSSQKRTDQTFGRGGAAASADNKLADALNSESLARRPEAVPTQAPAPAAAATLAAPPVGPAAPAGGQPQVMEFNHAINYVNKIKNRFTKDPDTYKTFLEILQTYQKETRPIQEVYAQVTELFRDAPDLLDEFKAFLPDTSESGQQQQLQQQQQSTAQQKRKDPAPAKRYETTATQKKPAAEEKKKRAAPGMAGERVKTKKSKSQHGTQIESPTIVQGPPVKERSMDRSSMQAAAAAAAEVPAPQPSSYQVQPYGAVPPSFPGAPRMQSAYDAYLTNHRSPQIVQADEFAFFDRVKRYLDDRSVYTEFLKLLNLFTQEIIDVKTLLEKSLLFFGQNDELVAQFKELVGYDPIKDGRIVGEDWIIDNESAYDRPPVYLHLMKKFGPSYRKLPESEIDLACSGREPLDWSVLNDEWVAFATWASEGSGAHRKNPFEEAMYNTEQERHWYSFNIESNLRTIAYLEPIAARIALMSAEERLAFKMPEGFGGSAPSVYERIIRKVYGKDHSWEILSALFDNPAVAVPIVLSRLKQKDEEWKRAEREWNKVWREVDVKNYYKALDHQGIPFKAVDKKATTTTKALTNEIELLRSEKQSKRLDTLSAQPLRPKHQFELGFQNKDVFWDVFKLVFSFLDRDTSGYSGPERARVETFIRYFVPLIFDIEREEADANLAPLEENNGIIEETQEGKDITADGEANDADAADSSPSAGGGRRGSGLNRRGGAADLRRRLLKPTAGGPRGSRSRANSPVEEMNAPNSVILGEQTWITLTDSVQTDVAPMNEPLPERRLNFYTNSTFYCLVRLLHTIYHRLATFKELMTELSNAEQKRKRLSPLAVELGLANPVAVIDDDDNPAAHYYAHMLDMTEKLFDGDVDQATYEEQLRYMAGIKAYPLFTIDKLVHTVIKHVHTINSDPKCQDLVSLLEKDRARDDITIRQQIAYRMEAEGVIGADEPLYRLEWASREDHKTMTIQLLAKEDLTLDDAYGSDSKRHVSWVASYALTSATEGVGAQVKAPFLKRNRALVDEHDPRDFVMTPGLEAKVASGDYVLHFVANTEQVLIVMTANALSDYMYRMKPALTTNETDAEQGDNVPCSVKRKQRFAQWLEDARNGPSPPRPVEMDKEAPNSPVVADENQMAMTANVGQDDEDVTMEVA
ncbi:hypothetical protein OIV83_001673 [Microbotryomycetes sp. JL201]|nr:hypothetical protein OIV83_001673 [Microbotryomycetes sp. JL201]